MPNYMRDLGYRTALVGKDGIKFKSALYKWDAYIEKTNEQVPGADEPQHERHKKTDYSAIETFINEDRSKPFCLIHAASLPHGPVLNELPNGLSGYDASNFYCDYEFGRDLEFQMVKTELSGRIDAWMKQVDDRGIEGEKEALTYFNPKKRAKWPKLEP